MHNYLIILSAVFLFSCKNTTQESTEILLPETPINLELSASSSHPYFQINWPALENTYQYKIFTSNLQQKQLIATLPASMQSHQFNYHNLPVNTHALQVEACDQQQCYRYASKENLKQDIKQLICSPQPTNEDSLCLAEAGVLPNSGDDVSQQIQSAIDLASNSNRTLFIPAGRYKISSNLIIKKPMKITGDPSKLSTIDASASDNSIFIGNKDYFTEINGITIKNLALENTTIQFYGRKYQIQIQGNIFYNTKTLDHQLFVSHHQAEVLNNTFLRGRQFPGSTGYSYKNSRIIVKSNFWGDLSDTQKASKMLSPASQQRLALLSQIRNSNGAPLDNQQSHYIRGWYTVQIEHGEITGNFSTSSILGALYNPKTGLNDIYRDHNIYNIAYDHLVVTGNYFSGWPQDPSGGLKFRTADTLYFAGNHLEDINVITYTYSHSTARLKNSYILNNHIKNGSVLYWQDYTDSDALALDINLFLVHQNCFLEDRVKPNISSTWRVKSKNIFFNSPHHDCENSAAIRTNYFTEITESKANELIPNEYQSLLSINIPLLTSPD